MFWNFNLPSFRNAGRDRDQKKPAICYKFASHRAVSSPLGGNIA